VVIGLAFSPDGDTLASGDFNGIVRLYDVATGQQVGEPLAAHEGWALSLAFSPDGVVLASGGTEGDIRLWQMPATDAGGTELKPLDEPLSGHSNWVTGLAFSPDGATLVCTSSDRSIRFWDTSTLLSAGVANARPLGDLLTGHNAQVWGALFDPASDGKVLVTLGGDGSVLHWDVASHELLGPPLLTGNETETMAIRADGIPIGFRERKQSRNGPDRFCKPAVFWPIPGLRFLPVFAHNCEVQLPARRIGRNQSIQ
jgi:WD40 repeat protein